MKSPRYINQGGRDERSANVKHYDNLLTKTVMDRQYKTGRGPSCTNSLRNAALTSDVTALERLKRSGLHVEDAAGRSIAKQRRQPCYAHRDYGRSLDQTAKSRGESSLAQRSPSRRNQGSWHASLVRSSSQFRSKLRNTRHNSASKPNGPWLLHRYCTPVQAIVDEDAKRDEARPSRHAETPRIANERLPDLRWERNYR